nr:hypothetical protein [Endozoicomonas sp.]
MSDVIKRTGDSAMDQFVRQNDQNIAEQTGSAFTRTVASFREAARSLCGERVAKDFHSLKKPDVENIYSRDTKDHSHFLSQVAPQCSVDYNRLGSGGKTSLEQEEAAGNNVMRIIGNPFNEIPLFDENNEIDTRIDNKKPVSNSHQQPGGVMVAEYSTDVKHPHSRNNEHYCLQPAPEFRAVFCSDESSFSYKPLKSESEDAQAQADFLKRPGAADNIKGIAGNWNIEQQKKANNIHGLIEHPTSEMLDSARSNEENTEGDNFPDPNLTNALAWDESFYVLSWQESYV